MKFLEVSEEFVLMCETTMIEFVKEFIDRYKIFHYDYYDCCCKNCTEEVVNIVGKNHFDETIAISTFDYYEYDEAKDIFIQVSGARGKTLKLRGTGNLRDGVRKRLLVHLRNKLYEFFENEFGKA